MKEILHELFGKFAEPLHQLLKNNGLVITTVSYSTATEGAFNNEPLIDSSHLHIKDDRAISCPVQRKGFDPLDSDPTSHICKYCNEEGEYCINPFIEDTQGLEEWDYICSDCYNNLVNDI